MSEEQRYGLAVIGGSGFDDYPELRPIERFEPETPYGRAAPITVGELDGRAILFMPRHGPSHKLPPHRVNYRANLWALREQGAGRILAVNAVGGIRDDMAPGTLVLPDQIIDYTHGREHSYFTGGEAGVEHIEFAEPFTEAWRRTLLAAAERQAQPLIDGGVYGCTQGPRLETAAEIRRLQRDGCELVGMTGMPEAALARELALSYTVLAIVVNRAAGLDAQPISIETIYRQLQVSVEEVKAFIARLLSEL